MSECYLCGRYIAPGTGYRRTVQTGTSTRIYATRRGGASFGVRSGLRTLCRICAEIEDRTDEGGSGRVLLYLLGWAISVYVGWQIISSGSGGMMVLIGLSFVLGLPVFALGGILEHQRRAQIEQSVRSGRSSRDETVEVDDSRKPGESIDAWITRVIPPDLTDGRHIWEAQAKHMPPRVGQSLRNWVSNWPDTLREPPQAAAFEMTAFRSGETILSWADRAARVTCKQMNGDLAETRDALVGMAKYVKPRVGEPIRKYTDRTSVHLAGLDYSLDVSSADAARRSGETIRAWLERFAPLCLDVDEGECIEDVITSLVAIGMREPPMFEESGLAWLQRIKPHIDAANADVS